MSLEAIRGFFLCFFFSLKAYRLRSFWMNIESELQIYLSIHYNIMRLFKKINVDLHIPVVGLILQCCEVAQGNW